MDLAYDPGSTAVVVAAAAAAAEPEGWGWRDIRAYAAILGRPQNSDGDAAKLGWAHQARGRGRRCSDGTPRRRDHVGREACRAGCRRAAAVAAAAVRAGLETQQVEDGVAGAM